MKALPFLAVAALFAFASPIHAINARCDQCDEQAATSLAQAMGQGDHVVFSLTQSLAQAFTNECDPSVPGFDPAVASLCVFPRPLSVDESAQFSVLQQIYRDTGGTLKWQVTVPIRDLPITTPGLSFNHMTIHEFARRPGDWHRVNEATVAWLRTPAALGRMGQWWQIAGSLVGAAGTQIEVTVVFGNGGRVTYKVDYGDEVFGEQIGPLRDSDGNVVAVASNNPSDVAGFFNFSNSANMSQMNEHFSALGWAMRFPSPTAQCPNVGRMNYECALSSGDLRNLVCRRLTGC